MTKTNFAHGQLKSLVERIERLEEEKKVIASDIKEIYAEAKANGFDTKIIRKVIALRKMEPAEREEQEAMLDIYQGALGMLPLFEAAEVETVTDRLRQGDDDRETVKAKATRYRMEDTARQSQELADLGLISQKDADETTRLSQAINDKWGDGKRLWAAPEIAKGIADPEPSTNLGGEGANAGAEELAVPSAPADVPHDPETGEILETAPPAEATPRGAEAGEQLVPPNAPASTYDAGEMPEFLRRPRQGEARV